MAAAAVYYDPLNRPQPITIPVEPVTPTPSMLQGAASPAAVVDEPLSPILMDVKGQTTQKKTGCQYLILEPIPTDPSLNKCQCATWMQEKNLCKCLSMLVIGLKREQRFTFQSSNMGPCHVATIKRTWMVRNNGKLNWPAFGHGLNLVCLDLPNTIIQSVSLPSCSVKRGETVEISIHLVSSAIDQAHTFQLTRTAVLPNNAVAALRFGERLQWK